MNEPDSTIIPGYTYGSTSLDLSRVAMQELDSLKLTVGWTSEDDAFLRLAGQVLSDQTTAIVDHWRRRIIGSIPHLARHSQDLDGRPLPEYTVRSGKRFEQWILDTCLRTYDQDWLNYQHEIARRHMEPRKNQTDDVRSTSFVPLRDIITFVTVMIETIKAYLAAKGHTPAEVEGMHRAWSKALQLQVALWVRSYFDTTEQNFQW